MNSSPPSKPSGNKACAPRPAFIKGAKAALFTLSRGPEGSKRAVLFIPPFAEEMNRCRRLIYATTTTLGEIGYQSLYFDFFGTGDSDGDFAEAAWEDWISDTAQMYRHLEANGATDIIIVALRLGALIASQAIKSYKLSPKHTIFIAPQLSGQKVIRQQLRARLAGEQFIAGQYGGKPPTLGDLQKQMKDDGFIDISGYRLAYPLIQAIENAHAPSLEHLRGSVIEAVTSLHQENSPAKTSIYNGWQLHEVEAPPVWAQIEPQDPKALAEKIVAVLRLAEKRP